MSPKTTPVLVSSMLLLGLAAQLRAQINDTLIKKLKPTVVNVETRVALATQQDEPGTSLGTGFVVDARQGLILTT